MSGILDSKKRIIDSILTEVGYRQLIDGELQFKYVSFTDVDAYYEDTDGIHADEANDRIYFAPRSRPQDQITPEIKKNNLYYAYKNPNIKLRSDNGVLNVVVGETEIASDSIVTGSASHLLFDGIEKSFTQQQLLGEKQSFEYLNEDFSITPSSGSFDIAYAITQNGTTLTLPPLDIHECNLIDTPFVWNDFRTSMAPNFKYMPPMTSDTNELGNYPDLRVAASNGITDQRLLSQTVFENNIVGLDEELETAIGASIQDTFSVSNKPFKMPIENTNIDIDNLNQLNQYLERKKKIEFELSDITFKNKNDIHCQLFEFIPGQINKLIFIDFGQFINDETNKTLRVFFAGKLYPAADGSNNLSFVNLFTMVFK